jgi:hypothetical protein
LLEQAHLTYLDQLALVELLERLASLAGLVEPELLLHEHWLLMLLQLRVR